MSDRPLERNDDRDSKMSEQPYKIASIRLDPGTKAFVHLRQKKTLEVDDYAATTIGDNVSLRSHGRRSLAPPVMHIFRSVIGIAP